MASSTPHDVGVDHWIYTASLKSLHDANVVHRDLKCANVFLSLDGKFKLGDLNVSKVAKMGLVYTQTGTPCTFICDQINRLRKPRSLAR